MKKRAVISRKVFALIILFLAIILLVSVLGVVSDMALHSEDDVDGHIYFEHRGDMPEGSMPMFPPERGVS